MIKVKFQTTWRESVLMLARNLIKSKFIWIFSFIVPIVQEFGIIPVLIQNASNAPLFLQILVVWLGFILVYILPFWLIAFIVLYLLILTLSIVRLWTLRFVTFGPRVYSFDKNKIVLDLGKIKSEYKWEFVKKALQNKKYYFLVFKSIGKIFVPKRAFENKIDQTEFEKLLREKKLLV